MKKIIITAAFALVSLALTAGHTSMLTKADFDRVNRNYSDRYGSRVVFNKDIFVTTVWQEGVSDEYTGIDLIAEVIYNRAMNEVMAGRTEPMDQIIAAICLKPYQFSCWNGIKTYNVRKTVEDLRIEMRNRKRDKLVIMYDYLCNRAISMIRQEVDPSHRYTHYYSTNIVPPKWASELVRKEVAGSHVYGKFRGKEWVKR